MEGKERRKYRRLHELSPVEFIMGDVGLPSYTKVVMLLHSMNISGGGVLVVSNVALREGFTFDLILNLRGDRIKAKAKVIRCKDAMIPGLFEIAIEFAQISPEDRHKVMEFIRRRFDKGPG
jgi:c-di-GMP-binding flagellar brake protein YcgR